MQKQLVLFIKPIGRFTDTDILLKITGEGFLVLLKDVTLILTLDMQRAFIHDSNTSFMPKVSGQQVAELFQIRHYQLLVEKDFRSGDQRSFGRPPRKIAATRVWRR